MNLSLSHLNHEYLPNLYALFAKSKFQEILHSRPQNAAGAITIVAGVRVLDKAWVVLYLRLAFSTTFWLLGPIAFPARRSHRSRPLAACSGCAGGWFGVLRPTITCAPDSGP